MSKRNIVKEWETDDFLWRVEEAKGLFFLHCDVYETTPRVMREVLKVLHVDIVNFAREQGKEFLFTYSENKKFVEVVCPDAVSVHKDEFKEVYLWELKQL